MILFFSGILFFIGAVYNVFYTGDISEAIGGLLIGLLIETIYFIRIREKKKNELFIDWIKENRDTIVRGYAYYNEKEMDINMEIVQFETCMSFLFISSRMSSRFYIKGYHNTKLIGSIYSLIAIIFGWWGLPWGPIYTIKSIVKNTKGGNRLKLYDLLTETNS